MKLFSAIASNIIGLIAPTAGRAPRPMEAYTTSFFSSPPQAAAAAAATDIDAVSLDRLSTHLERLLLDPAFPSRADIEIVLDSGGSGGGEPGAAAIVGAHSCILVARSFFFLQYFSSIPAAAGGKARLNLADIVPGGRHIGRDALVAVLGYLYTGRLKVPPQECVDEACRHGACRPAIDFVVESTYAASAFQILELVSLLQVINHRY